MLSTVYWLLHKGDSSFNRYFARWYDLTPMFETIGGNGKSSTAPNFGS